MARVTLTGQTGATGPKGDTGATGAQGPAGTAATVAVGTVTTGVAGSSAAVTNTGTSSAAVFAFTIPKGDKGDAGANGSGAGTLFSGAVYPTPTVSSQTIVCGDPYTSGNPNRTYTTAWLPGASDGQSSASRRGRDYSTNETYYYNPITTDTVLMLAAPRTSITGYEHYQIFNTVPVLVNASLAETGNPSLNRAGWTSNPAPERRVIYVRQDSTGGRQFILSPIPNGGQPLIDTAPNAVSRVELEWADFLNGWTLVSAPATATTVTYRPSGPQWIPLSRYDAGMARFVNAYYHRDYPTSALDTNIAMIDNASTAFSTLMNNSGGRMWVLFYGLTDEVWKPKQPYLTPYSSGQCQVAAAASGGITYANTIAEYFQADTVPSGTISTGGGNIGRVSGIGSVASPPNGATLGALHELFHPLDFYLGFLSGLGNVSSTSGQTPFTIWDTYIKSGATGYGTPNQATISSTLVSGTRIGPNTYGVSSAAEFFANAVASLYYWNATGDHQYLRADFGAHVYLQTFSPTRDHYWVDRAADLQVKAFVDWFRTNVDATVGTYTPVPAGNTPPVLSVP